MQQLKTRTPALVLATALLAVPLGAQMPGLPVLQGPFGNPGLTVGANAGGGNGVTTYAAAASLGAGRFLLSGGVGLLSPEEGSSSVAFGARAAMPLMSFMGGAAAVAAFAGAGGASSDGVSSVQLPVGAGVGYRRAFGATRGVVVHAAPMVTFYRVSGGGESVSKALFRASIGLDFAVTRRLGLTVGAEGGQKPEAGSGDPGPAGSVAAIGVSWALRGG